MRIIEITSAADPRVTEYANLTDVELRRIQEPELGLFLAESEKVIERALAAGYVPRSALMEPKWLPGLEAELRQHDIDVYLAPAAVLREITGYRLHRGALAAFTRKPLPTVAEVIAGAGLVVVMEDLVDHTNVGLIFRSAAALGADAVLVSPRCGDPLYRRSVKVSMGAVFAIPWTIADPWPWVLDDLGEAGFERLALTLSQRSVPITQWRRTPGRPVALLAGTEGNGLSPEVLQRIDTEVTIPMASGIDSLNVAAAAAVACFWAGHASEM